MTTADTEATLREMTGLEIYGQRSQDEVSYQYGYAQISFPHLDGAPIRGRREVVGGFGPWETFDGNGDPLAWAVAILKTGRTVGCGQGINLDSIEYLRRGQDGDFRLATFPDEVAGKNDVPWDLNPDYQRGHVWTDTQAERFVGYMLEGGDVPRIFVHRYDSSKNVPLDYVGNYGELPIEVIDGQQRIRAICRWVGGEIAAELTDRRRVWFRDSNEVERRRFPTVRITFVDLSREDRLRFYLQLNRGGTVHTDDEIQRVRDLLAEETR